MKNIDLTSLQTVEADDQIVIEASGQFSRRSTYKILRVVRVTNTQILTQQHRFRKKDGCQVGGASYRYGPRFYIYPLTPETQEWVRETSIREQFTQTAAKVMAIDWHKCTLDQLEAVLRIVNQSDEGR